MSLMKALPCLARHPRPHHVDQEVESSEWETPSSYVHGNLLVIDRGLTLSRG
jgi:hypothetical protein